MYKDINNVVNEFLLSENNPNVDKNILLNIMKYQDINHKEIASWEKDDVIGYLSSINSFSIESLKLRINFIRRLQKFTSDGDIKQFTISSQELMQCLDINNVINNLITPNEYDTVLSQLRQNDLLVSFPNREIVIIELAWFGLSKEEICSLKKSQISTNNDRNIMRIKIDDNELISRDQLFINDILQCIVSDEWVVFTEDNKEKTIKYKQSEYVIRPSKAGKGVKLGGGYLGNPNTSLKGVIRRFNKIYHNVLLDKFTLENLRRSRLVYEISQNNDLLVLDWYNISYDNTFKWYQKLAEMKYR